MAAQMGNRLKRLVAAVGMALLGLSFVGTICLLAAEPKARKPNAPVAQPAAGAAESSEHDSGEAMLDPMGPNGACYVCHMTFVWEELARVHLAEKITCVKCHGTSAAHANDENIGATKPDITYAGEKIDASCRKCHKAHDVSAREVVARWIKIGAPKRKAVCTDCHGTHRIDQAQLGLPGMAPSE